MGTVKASKRPAKEMPLLMDSDLYHLADLLDVRVEQDYTVLRVDNKRRREMQLKGFSVDVSPKTIDGFVTKNYAAIDLHMGGDLHVFIVLIGSRTISNFTVLWITDHSLKNLLGRDLSKPMDQLPISDFFDLLDGITVQGFYTDARKQWRPLPEAAHLDLFERQCVDAHFSTLLKV